MTTDKRTNGLTAEQIIRSAFYQGIGGLVAAGIPPYKIDQAVARIKVELADAGLLSEGAPSEEQIERAAVSMQAESSGFFSMGAWRHLARAALVAAQGAAPPVNSFDTTAERVKNGADSLHVAMQEPCPQPCEHLSADDARDGRDCREHPCTCPTAPTSDREKLIEEARAVAGPKSLYAHTSVAHLLIRLADALAAVERVQETLSLHNPNGRLVKEVLAALDGAPEPDDDPCKAETHSWSHYRPEQIDSYWIRCTRLGKHDEHEDSNTGLSWREPGGGEN